MTLLRLVGALALAIGHGGDAFVAPRLRSVVGLARHRPRSMLRASGGGGRSEANPPSSSPPSSSSPPPQTLREMQRAVVAAGPEDAASALAFVQASDTFCFYTPARGDAVFILGSR